MMFLKARYPGAPRSRVMLRRFFSALALAPTGPAQELGKDMQLGASLYFNLINKQGGVHGRKIVLKTLDDGYEATRAAENTRKLIKDEKVFALFGYVGTPTSAASL